MGRRSRPSRRNMFSLGENGQPLIQEERTTSQYMRTYSDASDCEGNFDPSGRTNYHFRWPERLQDRSPGFKRRFVLDFFRMFAVALYTFSIPFRIGYLTDFTTTSGNTYHHQEYVSLTVLEYVADFIFLVGIILRWQYRLDLPEQAIIGTGGFMVKSMPRWDKIDTFVAFPFEILTLVVGWQYFVIFRAVKIMRVFRYQTYQDTIDDGMSYGMPGGVYVRVALSRLFWAALQMILGMHLVGCAFGLMDHYYCGLGLDECEEGWMLADNLRGASTARKYLRSVYLASTTLVTSGFGDIVPLTNQETLLCICAEILGLYISGTTISTFSFIFSTLDSTSVEFETFLDNVNQYMRSRKLPRELQTKIQSYFGHVYATTKGLDEDRILHQLPPHLHSRAVAFLGGESVQEVGLFQAMDPVIVKELTATLETEIYSPNDVIIEVGQAGSRLGILKSGCVAMYRKHALHPFSRLDKKGDSFGEQALFVDGYVHEVRVVATAFTQVLYLARAQFEFVLVTTLNVTDAVEEIHRLHLKADRQAKQMEKTRHTLGGINDSTLGGGVPWYMPYSRFRRVWAMLSLVAIIHILFTIPLLLQFGDFSTITISFAFLVNRSLDLFLVADMFLAMRKFGFYADGLQGSEPLPVHLPHYVKERYMKTMFVWDILGTIPFPLILGTVVPNVAPFLLLMRLCRLVTLVRFCALELKEISELVRKKLSSSAIRLLKLVMLSVVCVHWSACIWVKIGETSAGEAHGFECELLHFRQFESGMDMLEGPTVDLLPCTWIRYDGMAHASDLHKYVRALYWAVVVVTTVGYGDVKPFTNAETVYATFWVYLSSLGYYGAVGAMAFAFTSMTARHRDHNAQMDGILHFMEHEDLSAGLRKNIRDYFDYQWRRQKGISEDDIFDRLPAPLVEGITVHFNLAIIRGIQVFEGCSDRVLHKITSKMRPFVVLPGDHIVRVGDMADMLVVLTKGMVEVLLGDEITRVRLLSEGSYFGETEFLSPYRLMVILKAVTFCDISILATEDFLSVVESHHGLLEKLKSRATQLGQAKLRVDRAVTENFGHIKMKTLVAPKQSLYVPEKVEANIIMPGGVAVACANLGILTIILLNVVLVPIGICFGHERDVRTDDAEWYLAVLSTIADVVYWVNIYMSAFHIAYEENGQTITDKKLIRRNYVKTRMMIDVAACLPLYSWGNVATMNLLRLPRLLRILHVPRLFQALKNFNVDRRLGVNMVMIRMFKSLGILLLLSHFTGCGFFLVSRLNGYDWVERDGILHEPIPYQYLRSLYWSLSTYTVVCFGDVVPSSQEETVFGIISMMFGFTVIAIIIGDITSLLMSLDAEKAEHQKKTDAFYEFSVGTGLPEQLRSKVLRYYDYLYNTGSAEHIRNVLPSSLIRQVALETKLPILRALEDFKGFEVAVLNRLASCMVNRVCQPGDTLTRESDVAKEVFFVKKGRLQVSGGDDSLVYATLGQGSMVGELAVVLPGRRRLATVTCVSYCEVNYIIREDFLTALASFPKAEKLLVVRCNSMWSQYQTAHRSIRNNLHKMYCPEPAFKLRALLVEPKFMRQVLSQQARSNKNPVLPPHDELVDVSKLVQAELNSLGFPTDFVRSDIPAARRTLPPPGSRMMSVNEHGDDSNSTSSNLSEDDYPTQERRRRQSLQANRARRRSSISHGALAALDEDAVINELVSKNFLSVWAPVKLQHSWRLPDSNPRQLWNLGLIIATLHNIFSIPFGAAFLSNSERNSQGGMLAWLIIQLWMDVAFLIDMLLKLFYFGRAHRNGVLYDFKSIFRLYKKKGLVRDLVAVVPLDSIMMYMPASYGGGFSTVWLWRVNKLTRVMELPTLMFNFERWLLKSHGIKLKASTVRWVKTWATFLMLGHWIGCLWYVVGDKYQVEGGEGLSGQSWVSTDGMLVSDGENYQEASTYRKYLRSVYFAFTCLTTVGYGDISSTNELETLVSLLIIVLSVAAFAAVVGVVEMVILGQSEHLATFEQNVLLLKRYVKRAGYPRQLAHYMYDHQSFMFIKSGGVDEETVLQDLSLPLRNLVSLYLKSDFVRQVPVFRRSGISFVTSIATELVLEVFMKGEHVLSEGSSGRCMLFVHQGRLVVYDKMHTVHAVKHPGEYVGETTFMFSDIPRTATVKAVVTSELYRLDRHVYDSVMKYYPELRAVHLREWIGDKSVPDTMRAIVRKRKHKDIDTLPTRGGGENDGRSGADNSFGRRSSYNAQRTSGRRLSTSSPQRTEAEMKAFTDALLRRTPPTPMRDPQQLLLRRRKQSEPPSSQQPSLGLAHLPDLSRRVHGLSSKIYSSSRSLSGMSKTSQRVVDADEESSSIGDFVAGIFNRGKQASISYVKKKKARIGGTAPPSQVKAHNAHPNTGLWSEIGDPPSINNDVLFSGELTLSPGSSMIGGPQCDRNFPRIIKKGMGHTPKKESGGGVGGGLEIVRKSLSNSIRSLISSSGGSGGSSEEAEKQQGDVAGEKKEAQDEGDAERGPSGWLMSPRAVGFGGERIVPMYKVFEDSSSSHPFSSGDSSGDDSATITGGVDYFDDISGDHNGGDGSAASGVVKKTYPQKKSRFGWMFDSSSGSSKVHVMNKDDADTEEQGEGGTAPSPLSPLLSLQEAGREEGASQDNLFVGSGNDGGAADDDGIRDGGSGCSRASSSIGAGAAITSGGGTDVDGACSEELQEGCTVVGIVGTMALRPGGGGGYERVETAEDNEGGRGCELLPPAGIGGSTTRGAMVGADEGDDDGGGDTAAAATLLSRPGGDGRCGGGTAAVARSGGGSDMKGRVERG